MKKIISIIGSETFLHEDLKSMFQDISEKDLIVKSVNDGEIIADNKGTEIVIKFGKFNVENISNDFKTEVSEFRNVFLNSDLDFLQWSKSFLIQNPNTSWSQFQNWFSLKKSIDIDLINEINKETILQQPEERFAWLRSKKDTF